MMLDNAPLAVSPVKYECVAREVGYRLSIGQVGKRVGAAIDRHVTEDLDLLRLDNYHSRIRSLTGILEIVEDCGGIGPDCLRGRTPKHRVRLVHGSHPGRVSAIVCSNPVCGRRGDLALFLPITPNIAGRCTCRQRCSNQQDEPALHGTSVRIRSLPGSICVIGFPKLFSERTAYALTATRERCSGSNGASTIRPSVMLPTNGGQSDQSLVDSSKASGAT